MSRGFKGFRRNKGGQSFKPVTIITGGILQSGYEKWVLPSRSYNGTTWTVPNHGGYSDSGYWGAFYYSTWADYNCYGNATVRINFTTECIGKTCTVTYTTNTTAAGSYSGRCTVNGTNIFNQSDTRGTINKTETYTFTIPASGYIEVYASYNGIEGSSTWAPSCNAGIIELVIS